MKIGVISYGRSAVVSVCLSMVFGAPALADTESLRMRDRHSIEAGAVHSSTGRNGAMIRYTGESATHRNETGFGGTTTVENEILGRVDVTAGYVDGGLVGRVRAEGRDAETGGGFAFSAEATPMAFRVPVVGEIGVRREYGDDNSVAAHVIPFAFHYDRDQGALGHESGIRVAIAHSLGALTLEGAVMAAITYNHSRTVAEEGDLIVVGDPSTYPAEKQAGFGTDVRAEAAATVDLPRVGRTRPYVRASVVSERTSTEYGRAWNGAIGDRVYGAEGRTSSRTDGMVSAGVAF